MAQVYDDSPEAAPHNFPEVAPQQTYGYPHSYAHPYHKDAQSVYSPVDGTTIYSLQSPYQKYTTPAPRKQEERTICGLPVLILVLSTIIVVLSGTVIGLAAGTGLEANKANTCQTQLDTLRATGTTSGLPANSSGSTEPDLSTLTNGCSNDPVGSTGKNYSSFSLLGGQKYTMYCDRDTPQSALMGLFVADFDGCMDACSSWSKYQPAMLGNSSTNINASCTSVSYIPAWGSRSTALQGGAPGNCYLKAGALNATGLLMRDIGTQVHAAILVH